MRQKQGRRLVLPERFDDFFFDFLKLKPLILKLKDHYGLVNTYLTVFPVKAFETIQKALMAIIFAVTKTETRQFHEDVGALTGYPVCGNYFLIFKHRW